MGRLKRLLSDLPALLALSLASTAAATPIAEPFFPLRAFHYGAPASWLEVAAAAGAAGEGGARAHWIDETALSGDRFLRIETGPAAADLEVPVSWDGSGTLSLRLRSRQAVPGLLRLLAADGDLLAEGRVSPQTEWGGFTLGLPPHPGPARLLLRPDGPAQWELRALDYRGFDREAWLEALRAREAAGHPSNLLPQSRFPLGLPQGWTLDRDSCPSVGLQIAVSETVTGPSGSPALRVAATRSGWLRSPAFAAWPDPAAPDEPSPHVASLWVAGEGAGTLRVLHGTRRIAEQSFKAEATGGWVEVPFTPPADDSLLCLELHWREALPGLHLDAVRVVPLRRATDQRLGRYPAEVALAARDPEALHGPGEALRLRVVAAGSEAGDRLQLRVVDLYGGQIERAFALEAAGRALDLEFSDPELSPFGSYRVHARVLGAEGAPRSDFAELILHRLPAPRLGRRPAPESRFGVHVLPTERHLRMAAAVGMNWVRLHGPGSEINYWFDLEPEPGRWVFQPERLARFREAGFSVLGKFTSAPRWASGQTEVVHTYFDQFVAPRDLEAWRNYVARLLAEYGAKIDVYEVWNEPWLDKFFSARVERLPDGSRRFVGLPDPAAAYAELTRITREAVDAADFRPPLIGLNTTTNRDVEGWIDGDEWTRLARAAGALDAVDIFSYHDYDKAADSLAQFDLSRRQFAFALGPELDAEGRAPRPVWNTEGSPQPEGVSAGLYQALLPHRGEHTQLVWEEAERLTRYLLGQFSVGVEKVFLYTMHNSLGFTADNSFSVLLAPDATLHPTGGALAALARAVDPLPFAALSEVPGGRLLRFGASSEAAAGERATEVFLADAFAPAALPPDRAGFGPWHDLFGNPVDRVPRRGATFFRESLSRP